MSPDELAGVTFVAGDITDLALVERTFDEHGITNVIHLAALQVPFCRANPPLGALVNVVGTVNVFEAVKRRGRGDGAARLHELDRDVRADRREPAHRAARGGGRRPPEQPLRRLQAGQRGDRPDLLDRVRRREHRPAPADRVRRRSRPGHDERADDGHRGRHPRPAVHDRVRRPDDVPVRRGRRADAHPGQPERPLRRPGVQPRRRHGRHGRLGRGDRRRGPRRRGADRSRPDRTPVPGRHRGDADRRRSGRSSSRRSGTGSGPPSRSTAGSPPRAASCPPSTASRSLRRPRRSSAPPIPSANVASDPPGGRAPRARRD